MPIVFIEARPRAAFAIATGGGIPGGGAPAAPRCIGIIGPAAIVSACGAHSAGSSTGCTTVRCLPPLLTTSGSITTKAVKRVSTACLTESAMISFFTASDREARNSSSRSAARARAQR